MKRSILLIASTMLALVVMLQQAGQLQAQTTATPPSVIGIAKPLAGDTQITFRGTTGRAYLIQMRDSVDASAPWFDAVGAKVIEIQTGVFIAQLPAIQQDVAFYRIVGDGEVIAELKGWNVLAQISTPANRQFFVAGEQPVITVTIVDSFAQGITRSQLSALGLYLDGPKDPRLTKSAIKLLGATADRTKTPHHFIDLKTSTAVVINGNTLTYTLNPVTDEAPGTYTASVRAVLGTDALQQIFRLVDLQIGTATKETSLVVTTNGVNMCAACHLGTMTGKYYMHHIDPSSRSPVGSPAYESNPVRSCTPCHNNDGYASFIVGGTTNRVSDAIVIRVHGVHNGSGLKAFSNTNAVNGNFADYTHVVYPANIKNCTSCHVDDRWKTVPTRLACGSCHDNVWFGPETSMPTDMVAHSGGDFANDNLCTMCHKAADITEYHQIDPPAYKNGVNLEISAPANGKFFVAGEAPQLTVKISDLATGASILATNLVDPLVSTNIQANEWQRLNLYVYGPRADSVPVLSPAAVRSSIDSSTNASTAANDIRYLRDASKRDPQATWSGDAVVYQLNGITNLASGTYTAYLDARPGVGQGGWAVLNFQVGVTNIEAMPAGNCISCHADNRIHASSRALPMLPDTCKACHDNRHQITGKTSWSSSQFGFGVAPLSQRIHAYHYGNYLAKPEQINGNPGHVILPQDVRNCTKCHNASSTWNEKPSRLVCMACHDTDEAGAHAQLTTIDPTPLEPFSGDEVETCIVCHGSDSAFSAKEVHAISNPYVPIYPREPRE